MSDEKQKIETGIGQKGDAPADAEITDLTKPEEDEVSGRCARLHTVTCPYCLSVSRIMDESETKRWLRCWNCSGIYQY